MNNSLGDIQIQAIIVARLLLAYILSAAIGWERERAQRPAGLRTHILVGTGAAGFMVVSIYGFEGLGTVRDPARVAAQIITGIGFLGAGTIWRNDTKVGGLTTAASIWMVAAIGMMAGAGMWFAALFITTLSWFTLHLVKFGEKRPRNRNKNSRSQKAVSTREDPENKDGKARKEESELIS